MIVTCPSCSARYKINESKIAGRGAKITCPRCAHRFVVYRDEEEEAAAPAKRRAPDNVAQLDFGSLGITWRVRKGIGVTYDFFDLATLRDFLKDGQVDKWDAISFDNRSWAAIETIDDLEEYFYDVWQKAMRGEVSIAAADEEEAAGEGEEDDSDAPTTIVGRGSSLASEIRQAITDASTPAPASGRGAGPSRQNVTIPSVAAAAQDDELEQGEPDPSEEEPEPEPEPERPSASRPAKPAPQADVQTAKAAPQAGVQTAKAAPQAGAPTAEEPAPLSVVNSRTPAPAPVAKAPPLPAATGPVPPAKPVAQPNPDSGNRNLVIGVVLLVLLAAAAAGLWMSGMIGGASAGPASRLSPGLAPPPQLAQPQVEAEAA